MTTRCLVVDRSPLLTAGLAALLDPTTVSISGPVATAAALDADVDVVVVALDPVAAALDAARETFAAPVVLLVPEVTDAVLFEALRSGVHGVMPRSTPPGELEGALRAVGRGGSAFPDGWELRLVRLMDVRPVGQGASAASGALGLTHRERQVVQLVVDGCSNKEVAGALGIATQTAKNHLRQVMAKTGARSRLQLCTWAIGNGVARPAAS